MSDDPDRGRGDESSAAHDPVRGGARRRWLLLAGAVGIPAIMLVLWWFEPQALLFDDVVDEDFPVGTSEQTDDDSGESAEASTDATPSDQGESDDTGADSAEDDEDTEADVEGPAPTPSGPAELATGSFSSRNRYTVTGTATAFELDDGQRVLRLEDFESTNGPDLFVYLTVAGSADDDAALEAEFVDLGELTGNIGGQNYVIPDDVDLGRYDSVVIWCRRFATSFGVADLAT